MRKLTVVGLALVAVLALGVAVVSAQGPRGGQNTPFGGRGYGFTALDDIAAALGLETADLQTALADGQTVAEIAEAQGVALEDVIATLVNAYSEELAAEVEAGNLSQAQADAMLALHEANLTEHFNNGTTFMGRSGRIGDTDGMMGRGMMSGGMMMGGFDRMPMFDTMGDMHDSMLEAVSAALGLENDALIAALQDGQSIAEVAEAQGVALEDVTAAVLAAHSDTLAAAVEAGDLTQEQADAMATMMETHAAQMLESGMPMGFGGSHMRGFDAHSHGMLGQMPMGGMRGGRGS